MIQHFIHDGRSETYACGANATGRRNTRLDTDPALTTCRHCLASLAREKCPDDQATPSTPSIIVGGLRHGRGWHSKGLAARNRAAQNKKTEEG